MKEIHKTRRGSDSPTQRAGQKKIKRPEMLSVFMRDIQNILSIMNGIAELTDDSRISTKQRHIYAAFIRRESRRIEHAISCMDDGAKLFSEITEYSRAPVQIDSVFEDIRAQIYERCGTTLNLKMNLRVPSINGDRERLATAFTILLDNLGSCDSAKSISAEISPCEGHISLRMYWQKADRCHSTTIPKQSSPIRSLLNVKPDGFSALGYSYAQIIIEAHEGKLWCIPDSIDTVSFFVLLPYGS